MPVSLGRGYCAHSHAQVNLSVGKSMTGTRDRCFNTYITTCSSNDTPPLSANTCWQHGHQHHKTRSPRGAARVGLFMTDRTLGNTIFLDTICSVLRLPSLPLLSFPCVCARFPPGLSITAHPLRGPSPHDFAVHPPSVSCARAAGPHATARGDRLSLPLLASVLGSVIRLSVAQRTRA